MASTVIEVREANGGADLDAFLDLPAEVYEGDPWRIPRSREDEAAALRDPALAGRQAVLVAFEDGEAVARLVARISPLEDPPGSPLGTLGFFEARERPEAVRDLFRQAFHWLAGQGCRRAVGPMDRDTWHAYRLNVGPFERRPFLMEPYHPAYYERLWVGAGFEVLESYSSIRVADAEGAAAALEEKAARSAEAGYRLRSIRLNAFEAELDVLYDLASEIFPQNFLYTPISRQELHDLYGKARPLVDRRFVWFAEDGGGNPVGFAFAFPDVFEGARAARRRPGIAGKLAYLWLRRKADALNFKTLGVLPEHQRGRVGALLVHRIYSEAHRAGFQAVNLCLIRSDNPSGRFDGGSGQLLRQYQLYSRPLGEEASLEP